MVMDFCPKCGARTSPTDPACLECGVDLQEERRKLRSQLQEQSQTGRSGSSDEPKVVLRSAASAGRALPGESSKETRLKVFDKQAAEELKQGAVASIVIALVTLALGIVLIISGLGRGSGVGWGKVFTLRPSDLNDFAFFADSRVLALAVSGLGLGSFLIGVGLGIRVAASWQAILDVQAGEKPEIVGLNPCLQVGFLLLAVCCPPAGIIVAIILRLSKDTDTVAFAGTLLYLSLIVAAVLLGGICIAKIVGAIGHGPPPAAVGGNAVPGA